jgi:mycobactin peptide synthetase MbtE
MTAERTAERGAGAVPAAWIAGPVFPSPEAVLPGLILACAERRPGAVAVRQWDERLTYAELADGAARLAALLRAHGVGPERRVAVCVRRRPHLVTAVLGVLLAGGAYVPVDPELPAARREEIIDDAGAEALVVDAATAGLLEREGSPGVPIVVVPAAAPRAAPAVAPARVRCPAGPDGAAYVLYTSGSTGRPKGVVVSHRSVVSYVLAFGAFTGADEATRSFGFASLGFDVSVLDLFVPLAAGGEVELLGEADRTDPGRLQRFAEEHRVTWGCVPVALLPILDPARLPSWRTVITGAEAPGPEQVERWAGPAEAPRRRFLNCYGPTEATVCVTAFETAGRWDRPIPMGGPLANHRVYVVDESFVPVPVGTPGELLIGGAGVARGYLGRPALTAERFIPDPFTGEPGARLYRTGDKVVWRPDGTLLFLGRTDRQVKVRGQRVEIGEVEAVVRAHPLVGHAVVEAVDGPGGLELVAFCTPANAPDDAELLRHCARRLPPAMVPTRLIRLDQLPLSASGKVDARALRSLATAGATASREPSRGQSLERTVAAAWARLLGGDAAQVGPDDDFFASGGHSVTAMRLVAALRAELGRNLAVEDVFAGRTLGGIVARVAAAPPLDGGDLPTGRPPALSPGQRQLWFVDKLAPKEAAYNIAMAERLRGTLDVAALAEALAAVARRHEVLRWRVADAGGVPHVEVDPPAAADLPVVDLSGMAPAARDQAVRERLEAAATRRFDLAGGPLWRAELLRLGDDDHVLALTLHHAVFDGWSQRPYLADLGRAYTAARQGRPAELPAPAARYADYVAWRAERDARRGRDDLAWWVRHLEGAPTVLDLPRDGPRPPVQTYRGAQLHGRLAPATTAAVRELAGLVGTTAPAVLLAGFAELLRRLTGQSDLVVGTPAADRRHVAFHDMVGFFIEVVPLWLRVAPDGSFANLVRACGDELLDVLAHPAASLGRIVDALGVRRDPARPPLVQVLFNVYNFPEPRLHLPGLSTERVAPGLAGSPFDLTVYVVERDGGFAVDLVYNADLYPPQRMRALLDGYLRLLGLACAAPDAPASSAEVVELAAAASTADLGSAVLAPGIAPPAATGPAAETGPIADGPMAAGGPPRGPAAAARPSPGVAVEAATPTEQLVAAVWRDVLGVARVGITENFFDSGGDSMAVVQVQARLAELLGREVRVVDLFRYPNVRALASYLDGGTGGPELLRATQRAAARRQRARARSQAGEAHLGAGRSGRSPGDGVVDGGRGGSVPSGDGGAGGPR